MTHAEEEYLARLRKAAIAIGELRAKVEAIEGSRAEPIAIVGMACRFPGGVLSPEAFWRLIEGGEDAITEIPPERQRAWPAGWQDAYRDSPAGRWGGFLKDVERFEPEFFGISPREAASMDPQQRQILEVAWEALENAGVVPAQLTGSDAGVFLGLFHEDYKDVCAAADPASRNVYDFTGNGHSFPPGRLSYTFGLQGPCFGVDTACSSSLVAVHLACQSLRGGESRLALAGGVSLILSPLTTQLLLDASMLAPDGKCKSFDARADGFVRSEGCGVVVLKRLSDAKADGDRILALIRGSAINQDGRSSGLTAPNVASQSALIRQALQSARVSPEDVGYVETHGTGTSLGDPIEFEALRDALFTTRGGDARCALGAVKSNIGHTEAAAGVAGLIKAVLALQHGAIPPNLHFQTLNPRIELAGTRFVVPTSTLAWPPTAKPRIAGVSSFGMSGTNAHVIVEEAPRDGAKRPPDASLAEIVPLSARSREALIDLAKAYHRFFTEEPARADASLRDVAFTASVGRSAFDHRLAMVGRTRGDLAASLDAFVRGARAPGLSHGQVARAGRPKVAFVFPGQGSQWIGMGRRLLAEEPAFRAAIEACDAAIRKEAGFSLLEELAADEERSRLAKIDVIQPVLFAIEVALVALWRAWGVEPDVVVGHSMGEVAAAHVAGALSLADAVAIICRRSRLLRQISGKGAMVAVELTLAEASRVVGDYQGRLAVAVSNGKKSTVLSGDPEAIDAAVVALERSGVFCRRIQVDVASHGPQIDPLRGDLLDALADITPRATSLPMWSTVTGEKVRGDELDAAYWVRNVREPVLFGGVIEALLAQDYTVILEVSPHPILLPAVNDAFGDPADGPASMAVNDAVHGAARGASLIASLRRSEDDRATMRAALGTLYTLGWTIDFKRLFPERGRVVTLPTYPWQREHYWIKPKAPTAREAARGPERATVARPAAGGHPLLGRRLTSSVDPSTHFWEPALDRDALPYLQDHRVEGAALLPGAALVEMALAAAEGVPGMGACELKDIVFREALHLAEPPRVQVVLTRKDDGSALLRCSRETAAAADTPPGWLLLTTATVIPSRAPGGAPPAIDLAASRASCAESLTQALFYEELSRIGLDYGPSFRGVVELWRGAGRAVAHVRLPEELAAQPSAYRVHPALLDACFQVVAGLLPRDKEPWLPTAVSSVRVHKRPGASVWVRAEIKGPVDARVLHGEADLALTDEDGKVLVEVHGLHLQRAEDERSRAVELDACVYELEWALEPRSASARDRSPRPGVWILCGDSGGEGEALPEEPGHPDAWTPLTSALEAAGDTCVRVFFGDTYERCEQGVYRVRPGEPGGYRQMLAELSAAGTLPIHGVIHVTPTARTEPLTLDSLEQAQRDGYDSILSMAQALSGSGLFEKAEPPRLWLVTRGVPGIDPKAGARAVEQAPIWGLGRVIAQEHPELRCSCVEIGELAIAAAKEPLIAELLADGPEDQIALSGGERRVARLVRRALNRAEALKRTPRPRPDGTYLITGGLGGIGLSVARWLVSQGARHLVLVGRSAGSAAAQAVVEAIRREGVEVRIACLDVASRSEVTALLAEVATQMPPLRGVHHAAGNLDDGMLQQQTPARFRTVMAPKLLGAWNLHELTAEAPVESFVLYSSFAATMGSPGQGNYAAANAFMDALAHYRRSLDRAALSINWGSWTEVGLAAAADKRGQRLAQRGLGGFTPAQGIELLERLLGSGDVQLAAVMMDWPQWFEHNPISAKIPMFASIREALSKPAAAAGSLTKRLRDTFFTLPEAERLGAVLGYLRDKVATVLGIPADRLDMGGSLNALGLDSLMGTELKARIGMDLGVTVPMQIIRGPSAEKLAERVMEELVKRPKAKRAARVEPAAESARTPGEAREEAPIEPSATVFPQIVPAPKDLYKSFPLADLQIAFYMARHEAFEHHVEAHFYGEIRFDDLDIPAYEEAWRRVIARHPMLRAVVHEDDAQQHVLTEVPPFRVQVRDLRGLPPEEITAKLAAFREENAHRAPSSVTWPTIEIIATRIDARRTLLHCGVNELFLDALSAYTIFHEAAQLYRNPKLSLPRIDLTYRDYVLALPGVYASEPGQRSLAYWRERLPNLPPPPPLPLRQGVDTYQRSRTAQRSVLLSPERWTNLRERAQARGLTPAAVLFAAYTEALSTFSNSQHFILNIMTANRMPLHPQVDQVVGNFAMLLPLEVDLRGAANITALAQRLQDRLMIDLEHRYTGGVQVLQELNRHRGRTMRAPAPVVAASALHLKPGPHDELIPFGRPTEFSCLETPQTWIDHQFYNLGDGRLFIVWDIIEEIFPPGFMDALWGAYIHRVHGLEQSAAWDDPVPVLVPTEQLAERAQINATDHPVSEDLLHLVFARAAEARPDAQAIVSSSGSVTYGQLAKHVNRVGRKLRDLGVKPNELCAVVMKKGWEQAAAVLGILAAGAAYVPIDPSLPAERVDLLLADAQVRFALTQRSVDVQWPQGVKSFAVDDDAELEGIDASPLPPVQRPEDLAYVIYTSGSTGVPKGVMVDHRGALNTVQDICERFGIGPGDRIFGVSALSFDLSVFDIFGTLAAGATLVLPAPDATRDPGEWLSQCSREAITVWNSAPQLMQLLVDISEGKAPLPSLRLVLLSGDWIPVSLPDQIRSLCPAARVISMGGATEASIWSIIHPIDQVDPSWKSIPYGKPLRNQQWHILAEDGNPCPTWVPGQLYIGGVGLAKGYWRDEEKTKASFVAHPATGERIYRTGDLGRYLPDGTIEFLGRRDFQVKIQGFRVELGEVESALQQHPDVREAAVVVRSDGAKAKRLVAYVVPVDASRDIGASALRAFLQKKLPDYMVPAFYIPLEALPLSPNGKLDRSALVDKNEGRIESDGGYTAPRDELEQVVAQIWEEVLDVRPIGIHDDFFAVGGQSFTAIRLLVRLQQRFGRRLELASLLQARTVERMTGLLRKSVPPPADWTPLVPISTGGKRSPLFLVHPAGGNVLCYAELARRLGSDQPVYGLQAAGLSGDISPATRIGAMAEKYIEAMQAVQLTGPYRIGGWSSGGVIAYEMARQLEARGQRVEAVLMLDTPAPVQEPVDDATLVRWFLGDLAVDFPTGRLSMDALRQAPPDEQLDLALRHAGDAGKLPSGLDRGQLKAILGVFKGVIRGTRSYDPKPVSSRILLLRADQERVEEFAGHPAGSTPDWGWRAAGAMAIETASVPGNHYTLLTSPTVATVATLVQRFLDETRAR